MINKISFDGLDAIEFLTEKLRLVLVTGCGPRIAFFGRPGGENLLYWDRKGVIRGGYHLCGGHRVWISRPYADESEDTYADDNDPCEVKGLEDAEQAGAVCATAPAHPFTRLARGIQVELLSEDSVRVTNRITNAGELIYSGGAWSPTCIRPDGTTIRVDLGEDNVTWDLVKIVIPRKFAGNTVALDDPQVTFDGDQMVVVPNGVVTKRCVSAPKGRVAAEFTAQGLVFSKQVTYQRDARYPLDGCNIAVFVGKDNWMAELETFGVEQSIRPGETIENAELWRLEPLPLTP